MKCTSIFGNLRVMFSRSRRPRPRDPSRRLRFEGLEPRQVLSTLILVDFDGATREDLQDIKESVSASPDIRTRWGGTIEDFQGLEETFAVLNTEFSQFRFLDFDSDGVLDGQDAKEAARRVIDAVRENFAPYDVLVFQEDSTDRALEILTASSSNDTLVLVSGPYAGVGGQALRDRGNRHDDAANVGAALGIANFIRDYSLAGYIRAGERATAFVNELANLISHEAGHTFGLEHVNVTVSYPNAVDPRGRSLMTHGQGWRNASFADFDYPTDDFSGDWTDVDRYLQNEHEYLTATLGPSAGAWAAVLRPGTLTIQGSRWGDNFTVDVNTLRDWIVNDNISGRKYYVDPAGQPYIGELPGILPDIQSMNQYGYPITSIEFFGAAGDDYLRLSGWVTVGLKAYGGPGNDEVYGAGGNDLLYGQGGDDTLSGGNGSDRLFGRSGNDVLEGEAGNDRLFGGDGVDTLSGGPGSDRLYGGWGDDVLEGDAGNDRLFGDDGIDTLHGGADSDWLYGGDDTDYLFGDGGDDFLYGQSGDDFLRGGGGTDYLSGADGRDYLFGQAGRDWLYGGGDDDNLYGGSGADYLFGDDGNDFLDGGQDHDTDVLTGGAGIDAFVNQHSRTSIYNPFTGLWAWGWETRDRLVDYDPDVDEILNRYEA